jgi:hypothetical protein
MNSYGAALAGVGLLGVMATAGCDGGAGGEEYATKHELDSLRAQYRATHDTMLALWKATDSMNRTLELWIQKDTIPIPRGCPPRCLVLIPPLPQPMGPMRP